MPQAPAELPEWYDPFGSDDEFESYDEFEFDDEFEPDEGWKADLRARIRVGIADLINGAKNRQLEELGRDVCTVEERRRVADEYGQAMDYIKELEAEEYEHELVKERHQRRWLAGAPIGPEWTAHFAAEQERLLHNIQQEVDQPSTTSTLNSFPSSSSMHEQSIPTPSSDDYVSSLLLPEPSIIDHADGMDSWEIKEADHSENEVMVKLQQEASQAVQEADLARDEAERAVEDLRMIEQRADIKREEARRKENEARIKQEFAAQKFAELKSHEVRMKEEAARVEEAKRKRIETCRLMEELVKEDGELAAAWARMHEQEEAHKIAERAKDAQLRHLQLAEDTRKRSEEEREKVLHLREMDIRRREEAAGRKEEEAREKEAEAKRREDAARLEMMQHAARKLEEARKVQELQRAEEVAKRKENELRRKEEATKHREGKLRKESEQTSQMKKEAEKMSQKAKEEQTRLLQLAEDTRKRAQEIQERERAVYLREMDMRRREDIDRRKKNDARSSEEDEQEKEAEAKRREDAARLEMSQAAAFLPRSRSPSPGHDISKPFPEASQLPHTFSNSSFSDKPNGAPSSSYWGPSHPSWSPSTNTRQPNATPKPSVNVPPQGKSHTSSANSGPFPYSPNNPGSDRQRRHNDFPIDQQERFRRKLERLEAEAQLRSAGKQPSHNDMQRVFERHERLWSLLAQKAELTWNDFPWPMAKPPNSPEEISSVLISAYMHSPSWPDKEKAKTTTKDRIKEQMKKWHPDRFETKHLVKVTEEDKKKVKLGAGNVAGYLSYLLGKENEMNVAGYSNDLLEAESLKPGLSAAPHQPTRLPSPLTGTPSIHMLNGVSPRGQAALAQSISTTPTPATCSIKPAWPSQLSIPLPKPSLNVPPSGNSYKRSASSGSYSSSVAHVLTNPTRSEDASRLSSAAAAPPPPSSGVSLASHSALGHRMSRASLQTSHGSSVRPCSHNMPSHTSSPSGANTLLWSKSTVKPTLTTVDVQHMTVASKLRGQEARPQEDMRHVGVPGVAGPLSNEEIDLIAAHRRQVISADSGRNQESELHRRRHAQKCKGPSVTIEDVSDENIDHTGGILPINAPMIFDDASPETHPSRY